MRSFELINVNSYEEASELMQNGKSADVMAGGTDILNVYKQRILKEHPDQVINLKRIPDSEGIEKEDSSITVKANTKLTAIAESEDLPQALKEAAYSVATPLIRNIATIGGNICQDVRCWYYRYPHEGGGRMDCLRKGGETCYSIQGENRYHSIFGGMSCHSTPCKSACPAGTDIPAYMDQIRQGNWDGAAEIFMQYNPMPMITSRICPHPCQDECNQCAYGDSVNIHGVERSLGDYILEHAYRFFPVPEKESGRKTAVIGAGPGGLTAAYYLRKAGNEVIIYDNMEKPGGVLTYGIPHYRLPKHYVEDYVKALEEMGIRFKMGTKIGEDISLEDLDKEYDAIYLGTGAWRQPILGLDGENLTQFGLNFLKEVNTYLEKAIGNDVVVCGGGSVAMDVALTAKRLGAKSVKVVCLETRDSLPATEEETLRAEEEGVEIYGGWGLGKVLTDSEGKVAGLESMKCTSVRNAEGRFDPQYDYDEKKGFSSDYIILATGQGVDVSFLGEKFSSQLTTARGLIDADVESGKTQHPKIYAGGDTVTGPNIAIRAIRSARNAARNINRSFDLPMDEALTGEKFLRFDPAGVTEKQSTALPELPVERRTLTDEDTGSFDQNAVMAEAGRCMNCGCYSVNVSDISPVLITLDGTVVTTKKEIPADRFFTTKMQVQDLLDKGELVTAVKVKEFAGYETGYLKSRIRPAIDFAIESLAYAYKVTDGTIEDVRLTAGGVAPVPVRLGEVESFLKGKTITDDIAAEAGRIAVKGALAMDKNGYKINGLETMVRRLVKEMK